MSDTESEVSVLEEGVFEVESILGRKIVVENGENKELFLVRWKGYTADDDTWEPRENFENCDDLLKDFEMKEALKRKEQEAATAKKQKPSKPSKPGRKPAQTKAATSKVSSSPVQVADEVVSSFPPAKTESTAKSSKKLSSFSQIADDLPNVTASSSKSNAKKLKSFTEENLKKVESIVKKPSPKKVIVIDDNIVPKIAPAKRHSIVTIGEFGEYKIPRKKPVVQQEEQKSVKKIQEQGYAAFGQALLPTSAAVRRDFTKIAKQFNSGSPENYEDDHNSNFMADDSDRGRNDLYSAANPPTTSSFGSDLPPKKRLSPIEIPDDEYSKQQRNNTNDIYDKRPSSVVSNQNSSVFSSASPAVADEFGWGGFGEVAVPQRELPTPSVEKRNAIVEETFGGGGGGGGNGWNDVPSTTSASPSPNSVNDNNFSGWGRDDIGSAAGTTTAPASRGFSRSNSFSRSDFGRSDSRQTRDDERRFGGSQDDFRKSSQNDSSFGRSSSSVNGWGGSYECGWGDSGAAPVPQSAPRPSEFSSWNRDAPVESFDSVVRTLDKVPFKKAVVIPFEKELKELSRDEEEDNRRHKRDRSNNDRDWGSSRSVNSYDSRDESRNKYEKRRRYDEEENDRRRSPSRYDDERSSRNVSVETRSARGEPAHDDFGWGAPAEPFQSSSFDSRPASIPARPRSPSPVSKGNNDSWGVDSGWGAPLPTEQPKKFSDSRSHTASPASREHDDGYGIDSGWGVPAPAAPPRKTFPEPNRRSPSPVSRGYDDRHGVDSGWGETPSYDVFTPRDPPVSTPRESFGDSRYNQEYRRPDYEKPKSNESHAFLQEATSDSTQSFMLFKGPCREFMSNLTAHSVSFNIPNSLTIAKWLASHELSLVNVMARRSLKFHAVTSESEISFPKNRIAIAHGSDDGVYLIVTNGEDAEEVSSQIICEPGMICPFLITRLSESVLSRIFSTDDSTMRFYDINHKNVNSVMDRMDMKRFEQVFSGHGYAVYGPDGEKDVTAVRSVLDKLGSISTDFFAESLRFVLVHRDNLDVIALIPDLLRLKHNSQVSFIPFGTKSKKMGAELSAELFPEGGVILLTSRVLLHHAGSSSFLKRLEPFLVHKNTFAFGSWKMYIHPAELHEVMEAGGECVQILKHLLDTNILEELPEYGYADKKTFNLTESLERVQYVNMFRHRFFVVLDVVAKAAVYGGVEIIAPETFELRYGVSV